MYGYCREKLDVNHFWELKGLLDKAKLVGIYNDFRYMKFIYFHCGEDTNLRDPRS